MRTVKIDVINEKALKILQELEQLNLIKLHQEEGQGNSTSVDWTKFKGALSRQSKEEIDQELNQLREEWD
jgi:hypothetical protein